MGRKNRKGRTSNQNPRRFYRSTRRGRGRRGEDWLPGNSRVARDPAAADDLDWLPYREIDNRRPRGEAEPFRRRRTSMPPPGTAEPGVPNSVIAAAVRICGRCREWVPRQRALGVDSRGECLHPASGFAYPPVNMEACPYFH
jgi:hypothetical protein